MRQKKLLMLCVAGAVIVLSGCKGSTNVKNNNVSTETQMNTMSEVIRNNQQSGDENYTVCTIRMVIHRNQLKQRVVQQ